LFFYAVEDALMRSILEKIIQTLGADFSIGREIAPQQGGHSKITSRIAELNRLAQNVPVFALIDLDRVECAPAYIDDLFRSVENGKSDSFILRICVKEAEAWTLADVEGFQDFFSIPSGNMVNDTEEILDPKDYLISLIKRKASSEFKRSMLPRKPGSSRVGLGYNDALTEFTIRSWDPQRASERNDSLYRALQRIREVI